MVLSICVVQRWTTMVPSIYVVQWRTTKVPKSHVNPIVSEINYYMQAEGWDYAAGCYCGTNVND
jgi:hypothetical protein